MFNNLRADIDHYVTVCCPGKSRLIAPWYILFAHPASAAVFWYRFGVFAWRVRLPGVRQLLQLFYFLGMPWIRMYAGVQIQPTTGIGPGLAILHFGGVVITKECAIGPNCLLYHNVSIITMKRRTGAKIGANFYAGVGTTIIGDVVIEDDVTCGAGSVVTRSIPRDAIVAGVPARILRMRLPQEHNADNKTAPWRSPRWMEVAGKSAETDAASRSGGDAERRDGG